MARELILRIIIEQPPPGVDFGLQKGRGSAYETDAIPAKFLRTGGVLEARVPGTGRDGGPSCATVKDFDGWMPAA